MQTKRSFAPRQSVQIWWKTKKRWSQTILHGKKNLFVNKWGKEDQKWCHLLFESLHIPYLPKLWYSPVQCIGVFWVVHSLYAITKSLYSTTQFNRLLNLNCLQTPFSTFNFYYQSQAQREWGSLGFRHFRHFRLKWFFCNRSLQSKF
jgi:hypothetical protein